MTDVWKLYQSHAREFDRDRGRSLLEQSYLSDVVAKLRPGARVLDLGCGAGEPIARFFIERGFLVTGIDAAPAMIDTCEQRFPDAEADMRGLVLPSGSMRSSPGIAFFTSGPTNSAGCSPCSASI